jgi:hypothetical protein
MTLHRANPGDTDRDTVSIIKKFLSARAIKDIIQTLAKFKDVPGKSRERGAAVRQLSALWGVTVSHVYMVAKNANAPAITQAPEAPEAGLTVDSFTTDTMNGISVEASTSDDLANLFLLQVKLVGWAKENEDELNQIRELSWKVSTTIDALEQARYVANLEFDKSDMQTRLNAAARELQTIKDIMDREREERRRKDNPETHGE